MVTIRSDIKVSVLICAWTHEPQIKRVYWEGFSAFSMRQHGHTQNVARANFLNNTMPRSDAKLGDKPSYILVQLLCLAKPNWHQITNPPTSLLALHPQQSISLKLKPPMSTSKPWLKTSLKFWKIVLHKSERWQTLNCLILIISGKVICLDTRKSCGHIECDALINAQDLSTCHAPSFKLKLWIKI